MKKKENKKIKILVYGDSPDCATGFGSVIRGIFRNLARTGRYEITVYGINDLGGWKDPEEHPYKVYPSMVPGDTDPYGRMRFIDILRGVDLRLRPGWDILFTLNDPFIFESPIAIFRKSLMGVIADIKQLYREKAIPEKWWKICSYWPVDSAIKGNWVENAVALPDNSVAYTYFGKREIEKADQTLTKPTNVNMDVIYHGVEPKEFFPISQKEKDEFREHFFKKKVSPHTFLVTSIARNQMRKDIPRTMRIFREFQKRRPDSFLYIHAKEQDVWGSLIEYARNFGLEHGKDWTYPQNFNENVGFPTEILNKVYNVTDVHMSTTLGEGHGLPLNEAIATKTVNLAPNITSISEIFNTDDIEEIDDMDELMKLKKIRGIPIKSLSTSSEWATYGPTDYERVRPLANVDDGVKKLLWAYENPDKLKEIAENAYEWIQQYSWEKVAKQWDGYFQKMYADLEKERREGENAIKKNIDKQVRDKLSQSKRDVSRPLQQTKGTHKASG